MVEHRRVQRLRDAHLRQRRVREAVGRVALARGVAHDDRHDHIRARRHHQLLAHRGAALGVEVGVVARGHGGQGLDGPFVTADAGHEGQAVDQLARGHPGVAGAQAVDDGLRRRLGATVAHHRVVALVLAGPEVVVAAAVVDAEGAARMPVGTGEEPPVAAFAQQRVPDTADLRRIHAGAAEGGAAGRVDVDAADGVAADVVFTALVGGAVAGLALEAEGHVRAGVVEVAQVLDVEAVVAGRVEGAGALQVGRHVVAAVGVVGGHPLHGLDRLVVAQVAVGAVELEGGGVPVGVGGVRAAGHRAVPVVADAAGGGGVAAARVAVAAVEAVGPLRQRVGVAQRRVAGRGGQRRAVGGGRDLAGDDRHRAVLVAGDDRLDAQEQRLVAVGGQVLDQRVLELLHGLPAPHVLVRRRARDRALGLDRRVGLLPARLRAQRRHAVGGEHLRVGGGRERGVFGQGAVAVAGAAVAGLHEPVQPPGRVAHAFHRALHQLLHRDGAVRAGAVVVEVAGHVGALRLAAGVGGGRQRGDRDGAERCDRGQRDRAPGKGDVHRISSWCVALGVGVSGNGRQGRTARRTRSPR